MLNPETSEMEEPMVRTGVVVNVRIPQKTKTACPRLHIVHYIFRLRDQKTLNIPSIVLSLLHLFLFSFFKIFVDRI